MRRIKPLILLTVLAAVGCNRDQVQTTQIDKAAPTAPATPPAPAVLPPSHPAIQTPAPAAMPPGQVPPAPQVDQALSWTLPKGWTTAAAGGMRYATLKPSPAGNVEVSVVMLKGSAGGELANANRWRSQLGLPPIDEAALNAARKTVKSKAGQVQVYEFANSGNRMVVGLLTTADGNTWFLKLMGEDAPVGQVKADFVKLLGTLTLG